MIVISNTNMRYYPELELVVTYKYIMEIAYGMSPYLGARQFKSATHQKTQSDQIWTDTDKTDKSVHTAPAIRTGI